MERERAAAALRAEQERRQRELAATLQLVAIWNSRAARKARPSFYPTIGTALFGRHAMAGLPMPGLPAHRGSASDDGDLGRDPVAILPVVLCESAVCEAGRSDG